MEKKKKQRYFCFLDHLCSDTADSSHAGVQLLDWHWVWPGNAKTLGGSKQCSIREGKGEGRRGKGKGEREKGKQKCRSALGPAERLAHANSTLPSHPSHPTGLGDFLLPLINATVCGRTEISALPHPTTTNPVGKFPPCPITLHCKQGAETGQLSRTGSCSAKLPCTHIVKALHAVWSRGSCTVLLVLGSLNPTLSHHTWGMHSPGPAPCSVKPVSSLSFQQKRKRRRKRRRRRRRRRNMCVASSNMSAA